MKLNTLKYSKMKTLKLIILSIFISTAFVSCSDDDDPEPINSEEVITTVRFVLNPVGTGPTVVFQSQDLDGDGGDPPIISEGVLVANTTYTATLELLNELEDPAEDITEEVAEEAEEHQFFFVSTVTDLSVAYGDMDANDNPIG